MYVCMWVCTYSAGACRGQRYEVLWSWSYRCFWATQWGCWVPDSSPLKNSICALNCQVISPVPTSPPFWGRVSVCIPTRLRFMAIFSQSAKYWDCKYVLPYTACCSNRLYLDTDLEKSFISAQWRVIEGDISDGFLLNLLGHLTFVISDKGKWFKGTGGLGELSRSKLSKF